MTGPERVARTDRAGADTARERAYVFGAGFAFVLFVLAAGAAYLYWQAGEREREVASVVVRLDALADARKSAVRTWLTERQSDAQALAWDPDLIELCIEGTCPKGMDPSRLQAHLDNHRLSPGFSGAYLFTPSGATLLMAETGAAPCSEAEVMARLAARERRFVLHDISTCGNGAPKIGFLFPIFQRVDPELRSVNAPVLGVIGLYLDPRVTLFPILTGRGLYESAEEVYLVRTEGDRVRILSPVEGVSEVAGTDLRLLEGTGRLERIGAEQGKLSGRFLDFRGRPVFAAARWISETGWGLIAKVDEDRALASWRRSAWMEAGLLGTTLLCFLLGGLAAWRGWAERRYRLLLEGLRDREERLRALAYGSGDVVFLKDMDGRFLLVNPATAELLGVAAEEAVGRTSRDFLEPGLAAVLEEHDRLALERGSPYQGEEVIPLHGVPHTYLASRIPMYDSRGRLQGVAGVLRDITQRKQSEVELKQWAQTLGALYRVARQLNVAEDSQTIFSYLLDGAVEAFGANNAALYLLDADGGELQLAAGRHLSAPFRESYRRLPGAVGLAREMLASGGALALEDCAGGNQRLAVFARAAGVRSLLALPLNSGGRVLGAMGLGFRQRRGFRPAESEALEALGHIAGVALDRSHAVEALVMEARVRARAEARLRRLHASTAGLTGDALFHEVARALGQELEVRLILFNRLDGSNHVVPYAAVKDGEAISLPPVPLDDTPCGEVVERGAIVSYHDGLQEAFPESELIREGGFRSYAGAALCDAMGEVIGVLCVFHDRRLELGEAERDLLELYGRRVAGELERILAEQRLAETRRTLDTLIENLPGAVYRTGPGPERSVEFISAGVQGVSGYPRARFLEAEPVRLEDLIIPEDRSRAWREIETAVAAHRSYEVEYRIQDAGGELRWLYDVGRAVGGDGGEPAVLEGVLFDHTERRGLEAQLTHSQRMDALGRLAGGVAHEFNNLLTAISGYAELLAIRLPAEDRSKKAVGEIVKATDRAAGLTRQLLAFGRRQVVEPKRVDICDVIRDVAPMVERLLGENVVWDLELSEESAPVRIDPGQVEQVLLNLVVNARDAMPSGGSLSVRTRVLALDRPRKIHQGTVPPGRYVVLEVRDAGVGMAPEVLQHIFEPFYTTKDKGESTGLGLATVYGVVTQSGGYVAAESEPGVGTTLQVYWPSVEAPAEIGGQPQQPDRTSDGRVVMLVEDEAAVRGMAGEHLRALGYQVLEYSSARDAASEFGDHDRVDAVITDIVMPGMSGVELADTLRRQWPDLPVVFISGHTGDAIGDVDLAGDHTLFLQKPFRLNDLESSLLSVLVARGEAG